MRSLESLELTARSTGVRITVRVKPRSKRPGLVGVEDGALVIALRAAPIEGAANAELVLVLSAALGVRRSEVALVTGASHKKKLVDVAGLSELEARARLATALSDDAD